MYPVEFLDQTAAIIKCQNGLNSGQYLDVVGTQSEVRMSRESMNTNTGLMRRSNRIAQLLAIRAPANTAAVGRRALECHGEKEFVDVKTTREGKNIIAFSRNAHDVVRRLVNPHRTLRRARLSCTGLSFS